MQCCVPFCETTAEIGSESAGITFHEFPREVQLRAAWLRALDKQDSRLPDSAVVCSLHFLNEDIYETANGLKQLHAGAIPTTVQVCMICLDTDSKMFLMSKHKLDEAYEQLTNHPPCDQRNLKQTLCIQCAQRLINFSRFRDKSLLARALMMDLVLQHEIITRQHITMIDRTKHQLNSDMVSTKLGPDHYDLHILEQLSEDIQTEFEDTVNSAVVKSEGCCGSTSVDEDMDAIVEDDCSISDDIIQDLLKCESAPFHCTLCQEEFVHEHEYMRHMTMHLQESEATNMYRIGQYGAGVGERWPQQWQSHTAVSCSSAHSSLIAKNKPAAQELDGEPETSARNPTRTVAASSASLATNDENEEHAAQEAETIQKREPSLETSNGGSDDRPSGRAGTTNANIHVITNCVVKLYDIFANAKKNVAPLRDESLMKTGKAVSSRVSRDSSYRAPTQNEAPAMDYIEPFANTSSKAQVIVSKTLQSKTDCSNNYIKRQCNNSSQNSLHAEEASFFCDICRNMYNRKSLLVKHMQSHTKVRRFTCNICQYKCNSKSNLTCHIRTHSGEKPYACMLCEYKSAQRCHLVMHMRTHTGVKPYVCKLCGYKSALKGTLVTHMRTHTGVKPYVCKLCGYKSAQKCNLVAHMRTHTGEKPHSCELCGYKSAERSKLVRHMRTHTGEKPHSCKLCGYKSAEKSTLVTHIMRIHTGEKPHSCELCGYKSAKRSRLVTHIRTHTGEKPYSCKVCGYKSAEKSTLVMQMRTHTGDKPYSCKLCSYKSAKKSTLVMHMRTHTGDKPYSCKLCSYKSAKKSTLVMHMRTHTGDKP